jgi:hypothetical protein
MIQPFGCCVGLGRTDHQWQQVSEVVRRRRRSLQTFENRISLQKLSCRTQVPLLGAGRVVRTQDAGVTDELPLMLAGVPFLAADRCLSSD